jgi:D-3-phosphoglycerate dehydrogenase / 2-oxoglutarate reductase
VKILAVGDSYMPTRYFREAFAPLHARHEIRYIDADEESPYTPQTPSEHKLSEYLGSPRSLAAQLDGIEVLAVQGAPVTAEVLAAGTELRLVACARGGPLNVDVDALGARGLPLVNTPGKNSEAVADLTLALLVMLARGMPSAIRFLRDGRRVRDNWEGARFMGADLRDHTLGLVGYGQVGQRVAHRALAFGMTVLVYDPFVQADGHQQVPTLYDLLSRSDFVSLHARATPDNERLIDEAALRAMKPGAVLVNTARESLVDEDALGQALAGGTLAGAALDVVERRPAGERHPLLGLPNVIITPHIGGATHETLRRGAEMAAAAVGRLISGEIPDHLMNPEILARRQAVP